MNGILAESNRTLKEALECARRGLPVAPAHSIRADGTCTCAQADCDRPGKHPRTRHGLHDATTEASQVREWWARWPDSNLLIRTGKVRDGLYLCAIDVDPRHNGDALLRELESQHGELPETIRVLTGGGGTHLFFWTAHPVKSSANKIAQGVDVRCVGGYVIAATSKHASGKSYEWDAGAHPDDVRAATLPPWLVAMAGISGSSAKLDPKDVGTTGEIREIKEGGRNQALAKIAGEYRRLGATYQELLGLLQIKNESCVVPKLDDWEVEKIARSVSRYPPGNPIKTEEKKQAFPEPANLATPATPPEWICQGLQIAKGTVNIIGGAGFGGKSLIAAAIALAAATGTKVFDRYHIEQSPVEYLDYEQGEQLAKRRIQRIAKAHNVDPSAYASGTFNLRIMDRGNLSDAGAEEALTAIFQPNSLIVIDTFRVAFPGVDENDSEARTNTLDMLRRIAEKVNSAVIVVMHSRKSTEDTDVRNALRGSGALFDAAQTVLMIEGSREGTAKVWTTKNKLGGHLAKTFGLRFEDVLDGTGLYLKFEEPEDMQANDITKRDGHAALCEQKIIETAELVRRHMPPDGILRSELKIKLGKNEFLEAALARMIECEEIALMGRNSQRLYRFTQS